MKGDTKMGHFVIRVPCRSCTNQANEEMTQSIVVTDEVTSHGVTQGFPILMLSITVLSQGLGWLQKPHLWNEWTVKVNSPEILSLLHLTSHVSITVQQQSVWEPRSPCLDRVFIALNSLCPPRAHVWLKTEVLSPRTGDRFCCCLFVLWQV